MFCKNCGATLQDGQVFCPECGTKQDAVQQPVATAFQTEGADNFTGKKPGLKKLNIKKTNNKKIGIAAVAVIAIIAVIIVISVISNSSKKKLDNIALYTTEDGLQIRMLDEDESSEITDDDTSYPYTVFNEKKNLLFYFDNYNDDGASLYYQDLGKKADKRTAEKIASNVSSFTVPDSGEFVIYVKNGDLYKSDLKDSEKIESDIYTFYADNECKNIVYLKENDDNEDYPYDIYSVNSKNESTEIAKETSFIKWCSSDYSTLCFTKDNTIYTITDFKDLNTITTYELPDDESSIGVFYADKETAYYYTRKETTKLSDYITDNTYTSDQTIESPDYWTKYDNPTQYNAELAAYEAKEDRDDIRYYLDESLDFYMSTLWYYDGKNANVITDNMQSYNQIDCDDGESNIFAIMTLDLSAEKPDLTDIQAELEENDMYVSKTPEVAMKMIAKTKTCYVAIEGNMNKVKEVEYYTTEDGQETENYLTDFAYRMRLDYDKSAIYYIDELDDTETGDLYKMKISGNSLGEAKSVYSDVYSYKFTEQNKIVSLRDTDFDDAHYSVNDLYVNDKRIDTDVHSETVYGDYMPYVKMQDDGTFVYYKDYDSDDYTYTLCQYDGKAETIADDVRFWRYIGTDKYLYLTDYNDNEGTLYFYKKGKTEKIDDDVKYFIMPDSNSASLSYYY